VPIGVRPGPRNAVETADSVTSGVLEWREQIGSIPTRFRHSRDGGHPELSHAMSVNQDYAATMPRTPVFAVRAPIPSAAEIADELRLSVEQQRAVEDIVSRVLKLRTDGTYRLRARRTRTPASSASRKQ
jgi:hypothetical protein